MQSYSLHKERHCQQVTCKWLQHVQVAWPSHVYSRCLPLQEGSMMARRQYEEAGRHCDSEAWEDLRILFTLEYVFGSIKSHAEKGREIAKLCLGEQCCHSGSDHLLLSTSQEWTLHGHLDISLAYACSDCVLSHSYALGCPSDIDLLLVCFG